MYFKDRRDAGKKLAKALEQYRDVQPIVYALPRGGVVLGGEVARALHAPLDLVITRKIGHPSEPEYAIGAVTEAGDLLCNEAEVETIDPEWLKQAVERERNEAARRRKVYLSARPHISARGVTAIIVDDGAATGLTLRVAVMALQKEHPKKIVIAVPVAPSDVVAVLQKETDEVITLTDGEEYLGAVGSYYEHFPQVSDEEVIALLNEQK